MQENVFFVLSSGRSGSQTVARTLNQLPDCVCMHHPSPELIIEASEYFLGRYPKQGLAETLRESRPPSGVKSSIYGEVNLQLSLMIPLLDEVFPGCRFVWVIRDGRDVVASMYYRGWYDPARNPSLGKWHRARLQGHETGDFQEDVWNAMGAFERCCWIWRKYNTVIESELGMLGERRAHRVHLESLKSSLPDLCSFLSVPYCRSVRVERHNRRLQPVTHWKKWEQDKRMQFESICGDSMDKWYPSWRDAAGKWVETPSERPDAPSLSERGRQHLTNYACRVWRKIFPYAG